MMMSDQNHQSDKNFLLGPKNFIGQPDILFYVRQSVENASVNPIPGYFDVSFEKSAYFFKERFIFPSVCFIHQHPQVLQRVSYIDKSAELRGRNRHIFLQELNHQVEVRIKVMMEQSIYASVR